MKKQFLKYWVPVIFWAIFIFVLSSISRFPQAAQPLFSYDKFGHALLYAVFGFLLARACKNHPDQRVKNSFRLAAVICAILYGITDEIHQYFVPERTMSFFDLAADAIGAFLGQLIFRK